MTKKLYTTNPYQTEFMAKILKRIDHDMGPAVILDQTCFYPESGGQPADQGGLNDVEVVDVIESEEAILHILSTQLEKTESITGKIDWPRRFDHMQQHSGQHILSQSFYQNLQANTIGFHLGKTESTIDLDITELNPEQLNKVETLANQIVFENRSVQSRVVSRREAEVMPLRKLPDDVEAVRVIEIKDFDWNGCCGTHVRQTGEVGLIKILKKERYKNGLRITFVCGKRALQHFQTKSAILDSCTAQLSVGEPDLPQKIEQMIVDNKTESKAKKQLSAMLLEYEIPSLIDNAIAVGPYRFISHTLQHRDPKDLQALCSRLTEIEGNIVLLVLESEKSQFILAKHSGVEIDLKPAFDFICQTLNGKGGGPPNILRGSVESLEGLAKLCQDVRIKLAEFL